MPQPQDKNHLNREDFIAELKRQLTEEGYGFVPLIGSGISHASGIMTGNALGKYLSYVIWGLLKDYDTGAATPDSSAHLADEGWPNPPSQTQSATVAEWATEKYCLLLNQHEVHREMVKHFSINDMYRQHTTQFHLPPARPLAFSRVTYGNFRWKSPESSIDIYNLEDFNQAVYELHAEQLNLGRDPFIPRKGVSRTSREYIVESAIRSLYDWRLALQFLARLKRSNELFHLEDCSDQYVIDSFNIFITQGRKPSLAHQMMSFLNRPLQIRKLLTTNFDSLLEDAYRSMDIPLQVFSIEKNSRLPNPNSVSIQRSLIKLHGGLHETRADYSLDESPDNRDKEAFLDYIWPIKPNMPNALPCHMLVLGTSIPDKRNVELIKYVCDHAPDFRIYVVAYDADTIKYISRSFGEAYRNHLVFTKSGSLDLMLYELYQALTFSLPPGGFRFEFSQYIPPFEDEDRFYPSEMQIAKIGQSAAEVPSTPWQRFPDTGKFRQAITREIFNAEKQVVMLDGKHAVTKTGATLFYELKNTYRKNCIWFELEDFCNPLQLITEIFRTISIKLGLYTVENISMELPYGDGRVDSYASETLHYVEKKIRILTRHFGIEPDSWCLFFYGRNVAGSCSGFEESTAKHPDNWYDWRVGDFEVFEKLLQILAGQQFKIIYLPYSELKKMSFADTQFNPALSRLISNHQARDLFQEFIAKEGRGVDCSRFKDALRLTINAEPEFGLLASIESLMIKFIYAGGPNEIIKRTRLVYSATLFRQSRHISALLADSAFTSRYRYQKYIDSVKKPSPSEALQDLSQQLYGPAIRFFNRKPGGLAWMFRDIRLLANVLVERFIVEKPADAGGAVSTSYNLRPLRTRMHFWIGDWYLRAFYSSNHIDPLKEALYHKILCIHHVSDAHLETGDIVKISNTKYRQSLLGAALASLAKILMISRESLRFWIGEHRSASIFYWPSVKHALKIPDISISQIKHNTEEWKALAGYVGGLIGVDPKEDIQDPASHDVFFVATYSLLLDIRAICLKLERDILRSSNHYPGMKDRNKESNISGIDELDKLWAREARVDIELFFCYEPGASLDDPFRQPANNLPEITQNMLEKLLNISVAYLNKEPIDIVGKPADIIAEVRTLRHRCAVEFTTMSNQLFLFLQIAAEFIYRIIRQAKFKNRCLCITKLHLHPSKRQGGGPSGDEEIFYSETISDLQQTVNKHWELIGLLSQTLLDLAHHLPPAYLYQESRLKIKLLTFAGLSLGRLNKFLEAHQLLNEGTAIVYNLLVSDSKREMVILRLRRAEVQIREAIELEKQLYLNSSEVCKQRGVEYSRSRFITLYRCHIGKLDDAWVVLDEVEAMLSSCMHSAFWCGKLYYMRLMVYAELFVPNPDDGRMLHYPRALSLLENSSQLLLKTLEQGMLSSGDDEYRKLCLLNIFAKASKKMMQFFACLERKGGADLVRNFRNASIRSVLTSMLDDPDRIDMKKPNNWTDILLSPLNNSLPAEYIDFRNGVVDNFNELLPLCSGQKN